MMPGIHVKLNTGLHGRSNNQQEQESFQKQIGH
jgi:hypothetical protein